MTQEYMGKTWDGPMSDNDKTWLKTWDQFDLIRQNEEEFSGGATTKDPESNDPALKSALDPNATQRAVDLNPETPDEDDEADDYDDWTVAELETEVAKRNNDPENTDTPVEVVGTGSKGKVLKEDLIKGLRVWDQENS